MKLGRMVTVILAAACVVSMAGCGQKQAPAGTAEAPKTTEAAKEAAAEPAAAENKEAGEKIKIGISMQGNQSGFVQYFTSAMYEYQATKAQDIDMEVVFADDDPEIREVVRILLESEGYQVVEAENGEQAASAADDTFDLIILDVMMPGRNGFSACAEIRRKLNTPILFLTARTQDSDKTMGFGAGGDDYLAKPFSYAELAARVKAMIRRYHVYKGKEEEGEESITVKDLVIQKSFNEVMKNSREILLTDLEYRILLLLASNRGKLFTIENIYESVWGEAYFYSANNTVMVHIRNLRRKLEADPKNPKYIVNVWGKGYRIE